MQTIARHRHWFTGLAVMAGIALSLLLLVSAFGGWSRSSDTPVPVGASPAVAVDGSSSSGPAAVPVNPWAVNDPATILSLCTQTSLDPAVKDAIRGRCTGQPAEPRTRGVQ
jgi:hypothetical protein